MPLLGCVGSYARLASKPAGQCKSAVLNRKDALCSLRMSFSRLSSQLTGTCLRADGNLRSSDSGSNAT